MVKKDMLIAEILETPDAEKAVEVLTNAGMHCLGCPSAQMETLEEACSVHGLNVNSILEEINK